MQVRTELCSYFLYLTLRMNGCALLQLPQVMTKTFAAALFANIFLLQYVYVFARTDIFLCDPFHMGPGHGVKKERQQSPPGKLWFIN